MSIQIVHGLWNFCILKIDNLYALQEIIEAFFVVAAVVFYQQIAPFEFLFLITINGIIEQLGVLHAFRITDNTHHIVNELTHLFGIKFT